MFHQTKTYFTKLFLLIAFFATTSSLAQKTTDDLGKTVFQAFKNKNMAALDTLIPSAKDMIELYSADPNIKLPERFEKKYEHHMILFKAKCQAIMHDTTVYKIDWPVAAIQKIELEEKKMPGDTAAKKEYIIPYLNVYFNCNKKRYCLQFKGIHNIKGQWKLNEHVRISDLDAKRDY